MIFLEAIQLYLLPIAGALGGLTALIIFIFSRRQRIAEAIKTEAEANETVTMTPAKITQMIIEASSKALEGQNTVNESLQKRLNVVTNRMTHLECRGDEKAKRIEELENKVDWLEKELGRKEANVMILEQKLARYEAENERYRKENISLKREVHSQQKRIKELEDQLALIQEQLKKQHEERDHDC